MFLYVQKELTLFNMNFGKVFLAELVGTFVLVLVGCGAAVLAGANIGLLGVGLAFGLAVAMMAYTVGPISGGHFNPAVTIGQMVAGKVSWSKLPTYLLGQVIGGLLGAAVLYLIVNPAGASVAGGFASNYFGEAGASLYKAKLFSATAGAIAEVVATFIFVTVILGTSQRGYPSAMGGLIIGLTLAALIWLIGPITNASLNPARSFATAAFEGGLVLNQVWFFLVWPTVGAILAALFHRMLFTHHDDGTVTA